MGDGEIERGVSEARIRSYDVCMRDKETELGYILER